MGLLGGAVRSECLRCSEMGKTSPVGTWGRKVSDWGPRPWGEKPKDLLPSTMLTVGTAPQHSSPMSFWECLAMPPWAGGVSLQAVTRLDRREKPRPEGEGARNASPTEGHTLYCGTSRETPSIRVSESHQLQPSSGPERVAGASGTAG